ncbi:MAG TPA: RagB/SusD family nutrient uptake outer membrane protein [Porphyromonadaceae bacterium]|jgi:hypothetical protein|nr:RagB/SusD family nutrient uptake outer membrane protein [Porphyromonadaceae bacterium]HBX19937.1 RagB/SusD family nutrient uptake outer membrane protein [Porphyromonadaceae bacterium]HCM21682.1 RagB/SusD family nutrient uptake outer membrane protein [Porphyromonadaceae bacterium]
MKKYIILLFVFMVTLLVSCNDFLDKSPDEDMTVEDIFTSPIWTRNFLAHVYSWIPTEANFADDGGLWRSPFVGGSDEMEIAYGGAYSHEVNSGAWNSTNVTRVPIWNETYQALRKVNTFLENVENVPTSQSQIDTWKGEGYFLRAYFHFLSFRAYGPIILLDHTIQADDDLLSYTRRPIDECIDFMVKDCDNAMEYLSDNVSQQEVGRATRVAALALKSRILLYAASPLYNGNTDFESFRDSTGLQMFPQTYDPNKWKVAADAALRTIQISESAGYGLYQSTTNDPVANYQGVFLNNWNKEILFAKNLDRYEHHFRCSDPISLSGFSIFNPTQEMVDAYEMEDGSTPIIGYINNGLTPIINPESGYVEEGYAETAREGRWPAGVRRMFVNREPRFYASINFPGQRWKNHALELWYKGIDGREKAGSDYCKTGYLMKKAMNERNSWNPWQVEQNTWVISRLAEIYLNYAEALNEFSGPTEDVYNSVNLIRNRSGLPDLPESLTKEQMRERIKHERRIELAFETHRFFDVRRWKDAEISENKPVHSLNIYEGNFLQDDSFYKRIRVEQRIFNAPKHYLFPIEQREIDKNVRNLVQNPGW